MKFISAFDDIFDDPIGAMQTEDWKNAICILILFIFMIVHCTTNIFRQAALPTSSLPTDSPTEGFEEEATPEPTPEPLLPEAEIPYYQFKNFGTTNYFINQRCYYSPECHVTGKRLYF
ncbi:hypothetical protein HBH69_003060 [Parastagonospora nodorum]|nr:hypothetical protein HBH69_003060 [Parastagonospora nodorum]